MTDKIPPSFGFTDEQLQRLSDHVQSWPRMTMDEMRERNKRSRRVFFRRFWENISIYADEAASLTTYKGEIPNSDLFRELYTLQMHSVVLLSLSAALRANSVLRFKPGFLDHACASGVLAPDDCPLIAAMDAQNDLSIPLDAEARSRTATARACMSLNMVLSVALSTSRTALLFPDKMAVMPGYADPRARAATDVFSFEVEPVPVPAEPFDDVDFVKDALEALCSAQTDSRMKTDAHAFIANRVALGSLGIWRTSHIGYSHKTR